MFNEAPVATTQSLPAEFASNRSHNVELTSSGQLCKENKGTTSDLLSNKKPAVRPTFTHHSRKHLPPSMDLLMLTGTDIAEHSWAKHMTD